MSLREGDEVERGQRHDAVLAEPQLSTSSLLSWALGNEESCISLSEQVAHRDNVQPPGNAAVRLESPHTRMHTR